MLNWRLRVVHRCRKFSFSRLREYSSLFWPSVIFRLTNVGGSTNYYRHGCQPISWLQVSTKGNSIVPVGGEIILSLTGVAAHPGVFDLGSLVIRASIDSFTHTSAVAIFPRQPHYVTVKQHSDWTGTVGQTDWKLFYSSGYWHDMSVGMNFSLNCCFLLSTSCDRKLLWSAE